MTKRKNEGLFQLDFIVEKRMILREFLAEQDISKTTLTAVKYGGGEILVNGAVQNVRYMAEPADRVTVIFPPEQCSGGLLAEDGDLAVIYEDDALLIVDKPAGQSTIPSRNHPSGTLANSICGKFAREKIQSTAHMVTRLDTDTSGIICAAKNRHIHHLLSKQMNEGLFDRKYTAIAEGVIKERRVTIEQPIGRKDGSIIERTVRADGQYAKTDAVVKAVSQTGIGATVVDLTLHTGRTHQIRVHLQWLGHPLAGDDLYGAQEGDFPRQALHCSSISFFHPLTKERLAFTSPLPEDMQRYLERKKLSY